MGRSYDSVTNPLKDANSGLFGPLVICRYGILNDNNERTDQVDREFAVNYETYDENFSHYLEKNVVLYAPDRGDLNNPVFKESNRMRAINGFMFFNTPSMNISVGEEVYWYFLSTGSENSQHSATFHGQPVEVQMFGNVKHDAVVSIESGTYYTVKMDADHASVWMFRDHNGFNMWNGMMASFTITTDPVP